MFQVPHVIPTPGNLRFRRVVRLPDGIIYGIIRRRRAQAGDQRAGDLLSMLLDVRDEDTGEGMSDEQLRDEVMTIFVAGHETTANALSWTWYLLAGQPEAETRLLAELEEVLGDRAPTVEDFLPRLRYADAVIKESLRLYPPAWAFGREAVGDREVGGYHVPAGTQLVVSQWITHRDERFLKKRRSSARSGGWTARRRSCPGTPTSPSAAHVCASADPSPRWRWSSCSRR